MESKHDQIVRALAKCDPDLLAEITAHYVGLNFPSAKLTVVSYRQLQDDFMDFDFVNEEEARSFKDEAGIYYLYVESPDNLSIEVRKITTAEFRGLVALCSADLIAFFENRCGELDHFVENYSDWIEKNPDLYKLLPERFHQAA